jgi:Na+/glutamate symporter
MQCFSHEQSAAIGICRQCGRTVCRQCAIVHPLAIYCSEACVEVANQTDAVVATNRRILSRASMSGYKAAALELLVGISLLGFTQFPLLREASPILLIMAVLMILYSLFHFVGAWRLSRDNQQP